MKDAKKTKQVLFLETEKRHADLKIKLKQYGISQSDFIRGCISGLISDDEQFLPFFFKLLEEKSYLKSAKNNFHRHTWTRSFYRHARKGRQCN